MIANISSAVSNFEETLNTLKYANRAKNIKTRVTKNEVSSFGDCCLIYFTSLLTGRW